MNYGKYSCNLSSNIKKMYSANNLKKIRESKLISKAELSRKTGLSFQTIDRIEKGYPCRLDTKRKILIALGLKFSNRKKVFKD